MRATTHSRLPIRRFAYAISQSQRAYAMFDRISLRSHRHDQKNGVEDSRRDQEPESPTRPLAVNLPQRDVSADEKHHEREQYDREPRCTHHLTSSFAQTTTVMYVPPDAVDCDTPRTSHNSNSFSLFSTTPGRPNST